MKRSVIKLNNIFQAEQISVFLWITFTNKFLTFNVVEQKSFPIEYKSLNHIGIH